MTKAAHRIIPYHLPLRRLWRTAHGTLEAREGWLLALSDEVGRWGYGDGAPLPEAGTEEGGRSLFALQQFFQGTEELSGWGAETPAARCAIETAWLDLQAQREEIPLARLLNPEAAESVRVNANLGALDGEVVSRLAGADGCKVIKLKVGLAPVADELAYLRALVPQLGDDIRLRLDANQAWGEAEAGRFIAGLAGLPIESLEEPLRDPSLDALARLQRLAPFPLALDESLAAFELAALAESGAVGRVVIKPMVVGGPSAGYVLARRAQALGLEVVVTSVVESAIGVWAACHLAAALDPEMTLAHGLATSGWLLADCAQAPHIEAGVIRLPTEPGLGVVPDGRCLD